MAEAPFRAIYDAFDILTSEVQAACDDGYEAVKRAVDARDGNLVRATLDRTERIEAFAQRVADLLSEWTTMVDELDRHEEREESTDESGSVQRRNLGRLRKGLRTRDDAFYLPILRSLIGRGGSASVSEVTEDVGREMRGLLNEYDLQPLKSEPQTLRWRNAVQWARHDLVKKGLLKTPNTHGVWEISERGRIWAANDPSSGSVS